MYTKENNQTANSLIPGYLKGELTDSEIRELLHWIQCDDANKRYFDEYCEIWITAKSSLKKPVYNFQEGFWKFRQQIRAQEAFHIRSNDKKLSKEIVRYAAIFVMTLSLCGLLFYFIGKNHAAIPYQSISELVVPLGSRVQFTLSDGTKVTLNSGSKLKCDNRFGINDRIVQLEGEGYFDVAKDNDKPFTVKTSHLSIKALGTIFNVKAYSDDKTIETTLVEGLVKIEEIAELNSTKHMVLKPNQKLTFFKEDSKLSEGKETEKIKNGIITQPPKIQKSIELPRLVTENINVEPAISWKDNRWIFEKQSLSQIAIDLERKFDIEIQFESERLKTFRFTGIIIAEPIEQVLEVMSLSAPINFKLKGRIVTLYENRHFEELNKNLYNQQ